MIPKIIHYCWFGSAQKPQDVLAYIDSWHRVFPDFEILEWNETNFDVNISKYFIESYKKKSLASPVIICVFGHFTTMVDYIWMWMLRQ